MRLVAIHGGGDWADASAEYLIVPPGVNLEAEYEARKVWYRDTYCPAYRAWQDGEGRKHWDDPTRERSPEYLSFFQWLIRHCGAREATDEIEVFEDV